MSEQNPPAGAADEPRQAISIVSRAGLNDGEPTLAGTALRVAEIVLAGYRGSIDEAAALEGDDGRPIGEAGLDAAIDYCASQHCEQALRFCTGCRLRDRADGLDTIDDFLKSVAGVDLAGPGLRIEGGAGASRIAASSLAALVKSWQGEEIWFLARRLHRRLLKRRDPRKKSLAGAEGAIAPAIVLVGPQMAENIGMVARAMANFGLEDLRLVAPRDGWPNEKAEFAASGATYVIEGASAHATTAEAIGDLNWICATTARQRFMAKPVLSPEQAAAEMRRRIGEGQKVGILFGAERQGLENDDVALADAIVMAPVNPRFASLNLAQAVLLIGYEWMKESARATLGRVTTYEAPIEAGTMSRGEGPATRAELVGFFEHLEQALDEAGFLKPPDKRAHMIRNIRTMFERMEASPQEVRTLRGIVAALTLAHKRRRAQP
ncbi:MAG: RNA methyltransferase [Hyphomicrobiaceae bacterium]